MLTNSLRQATSRELEENMYQAGGECKLSLVLAEVNLPHSDPKLLA
jgi:hypothetical protein